MFQKVNVSRESSVMPGAEEEEIAAVQINEDIVDLENEDEEAPQPSPVAVPKKRGAAAVACSPKKRKKDPYRKDFKRFVDHAISEDLTEVSSNVSVANDIDPMSLQELLSDHEDEDEEDSGSCIIRFFK